MKKTVFLAFLFQFSCLCSATEEGVLLVPKVSEDYRAEETREDFQNHNRENPPGRYPHYDSDPYTIAATVCCCPCIAAAACFACPVICCVIGYNALFPREEKRR